MLVLRIKDNLSDNLYSEKNHGYLGCDGTIFNYNLYISHF